jgi:hypothetical protein
VGKWINGALQVDTIGFLDSTTLDAAGLPHSEALHVTETYRPSSDGQHMRVRITIEDPKTYAKSWSTELHFRRNPSGEIHEDYCLERKGIQWGHLRQTGIDIKEGR